MSHVSGECAFEPNGGGVGVRSTYQDLVIAKGRHGSGVILLWSACDHECACACAWIGVEVARKARLREPRGAAVAGPESIHFEHMFGPRTSTSTSLHNHMPITAAMLHPDTGSGYLRLCFGRARYHERDHEPMASKLGKNRNDSKSLSDRTITSHPLCQRSISSPVT